MKLRRCGSCRAGVVMCALVGALCLQACLSAPREQEVPGDRRAETPPREAHAMPEAAAPEMAAAGDEMAGDGAEAPADELDVITICSFNVQWVGQSSRRDNAALAELVAPYDVVLVQEIVSPPFEGEFPWGDPYRPDDESAAFLEAMLDEGFHAWYSEQDTGTLESNDNNGAGTEWWAVFYKGDRLDTPGDLPWGFLADDVTANPDYDRVPYAFAFRTPDERLDFVLVSVHLNPDDDAAGALRREHELGSIAAWIDDNDDEEGDLIIVGDMNIQDADELATATPAGFLSLNDECRPTNTNVNGPKPYDHAMYRPASTPEIDETFDLEVINLIDAFRADWLGTAPYPGGPPYDHNEFRAIYSDHHPIVFRLIVPEEDDD